MWTSPNGGGEENPACLRTPHLKAKVEVGLLSVTTPDGGSFDKVVWLRCL